MTEYILIEVPRYGWLCRIEQAGKEIYRGEYQLTPYDAFEKAREWQEEQA